MFASSLLFLWTACEDPSNVGIGLLEEDLAKDRPGVVTVTADTLEQKSAEIVTGGTGTTAPRTLAGRVVDPLLGTFTATGHMDFAQVSTTDDFREGNVTAAELRLFRQYVYGDTTSTVTLRLRDMPEEWNPVNATADTVLQGGPPITEFSFSATDSLIVVPLPADWIAARDTTLRSTAFDSTFHGFQLEYISNQAVVGFETTSRLRVVSGEDTVSYPVGKVLTSLERPDEPPPPSDLLVVQNGTGPNAVLGFDFEAAGFTDNALNQASLRLYADTTLLTQNTPPGFSRPLLRSLTLVGVSEDGRPVVSASGSLSFLRSVSLNSEGIFTLSNQDVDAFTATVQRMLLGSTAIARFELRPNEVNITINPTLLYRPAAEEKAPKAVLTVSGTEQ